MIKTYKQEVICGNCDYHKIIEIILGKQVYEEKCPNCGCNTLGAVHSKIKMEAKY